MRPSTHGQSGFFSTRELLRLSSAIFLLGIVGLMYVQSKKASSWRTIASEQESPDQATTEPKPSGSSSDHWRELVVPHPGHNDPEEIDALREEKQAIGDQTPLAAEEMPAYWRMLKWAYAVPGEELKKQARTDLMFTHLFQSPNKYRGALVNVKLRVRRVLHHEAPQNSANVTDVYEAWGPSQDSQTYPYCVVFVDVPPGVPVSPSVEFDARFVGFFYKKLAYEDAMGNQRSAPLLIGRMINDPALQSQSQPDQGLSLQWILGIVLSLIAALVLLQWWSRVATTTSRTPLIDEAKVDTYLGHLELGEPVDPSVEPLENPPPD